MTIYLNDYNRFLTRVAEDLDIPPTKYQIAVDRYEAVGRWLESSEDLGRGEELKIYVQGSFRLGTVVRPLIGGNEAAYDIDLVCEIPINKHETTPQEIKTDVGDRLKDNATYSRMLDDEGRRCWTLNYSEQDGIGFHLDVLPAVSNQLHTLDTAIALTHKENNGYTWSASNPNGYAEWFDKRNQAAFQLVEHAEREAILSKYVMVYDSIDQVPEQLVRTPLQRAIQLMKRHRDARFNGHEMADMKPISMIITTLAAQLYQNESDVFSALKTIIERLHAHSVLMHGSLALDGVSADLQLIKRLPDGRWYIGNPVNREENFADRWHENNNARAKAFFAWVDWIKRDLIDILAVSDTQQLRKNMVASLGETHVNKHLDLLSVLNVSVTANKPRELEIQSFSQPWKC